MKNTQSMAELPVSPVVLVILDGWGYRESDDGNAIALAKTPVMDSLWAAYPHTLIRTSGKAVGLPDGQMGNSEVGHLNLGAGRVVPQELVRISDAVEDGSILDNEALNACCQDVKRSGGKLHAIGLCSDGGVHSHIDHLAGILDLARAAGIEDVCIHAITDGRDTKPSSGREYLARLQDLLDAAGIGRIVTVSGRYYAMDRDHRWDRVQLAYDVMVDEGPGSGESAIAALEAAYGAEITDEFVKPTRLAPGAIAPGDGVIFFNFRPDRARQLTQAFVDPNFKGFERSPVADLSFVTFTQYDPDLPVRVAFEPQNLEHILGQVIADHGLRQLRTAETEKYAHVTYFFNGGLEDPFEGEERVLIPSPMVATYDRAPAMSAQAVTEAVTEAVNQRVYSLVVVNYANPDMVGHTGKMDAAIAAIETVDRCLGQVIEAVGKAGGTLLITADHGNAECMYDEQGNPWTAHTTNRVPFIVVEGERRKIVGHGAEVALREDGCLADVAPTILEILGLPQPKEMTGRSMIAAPAYEAKRNRTPVSVAL
ncbi:MAG: 2,3-bisphosphoglycerate-independent phosphoglycerate mutase [Cyanophyceae cyanobacterium]